MSAFSLPMIATLCRAVFPDFVRKSKYVPYCINVFIISIESSNMAVAESGVSMGYQRWIEWIYFTNDKLTQSVWQGIKKTKTISAQSGCKPDYPNKKHVNFTSTFFVMEIRVQSLFQKFFGSGQITRVNMFEEFLSVFLGVDFL